MHVQIPLRDVFRLPTIEQLAQTITKTELTGYAAIPAIEKDLIIRYPQHKNGCTS
ncbi:hypothetical protein [Bacillus velezensis]|uniref:hypothetical protein n=1 Tax=Bacillus velezensis TaxID=492670 RepID=UPI0039FC5608